MTYGEISRQNIMDAFWKLYSQKDIRDISIKEVAELAGYHRTTFYNHFSSLQDILDTIEEALLPGSPGGVDDYFQGRRQPGEIIGSFLRNFMEHAEHLHVLFGPHGDPDFVARYLEAVRPTFERAYEGYLKIKNPELDLVQEFIFAGSFALINRWYSEHRDKMDAAQVEAVMNAMYYEGIFTFTFGKGKSMEAG